MIDHSGNIRKGSLAAYYKIVDTSHQYHSISCEAYCDEWGGTDYAVAEKRQDTIRCYTLCNSGTHCSLHLLLVKDSCYATIRLKSVSRAGNQLFYCYKGHINIDRKALAKDILKAGFSFDFTTRFNPRMFWKGRIYTKIEHPKN